MDRELPAPSNGEMNMKRIALIGLILLTLAAALFVANCTREKTVESTEYVHDIKYVDSPPDTIVRLDTILRADTVKLASKDTVRVVDTVHTTNTVHDTVRVTQLVHDTVRVTVTVHDTVVTVKTHFDTVTVTVTDTVLKTQAVPNAVLAISAMEFQTDPLVYNYVAQNVGDTGGWVLYLSPAQMAVSPVSSGVYDITSYVDYYAADFSGDYPMYVKWRMTYQSGDPSNPSSWQMSNPPGAVSPGLTTAQRGSAAHLLTRPTKY